MSAYDRRRRGKKKKFRVPGRRLPTPTEFKLSTKIVPHKRLEDEKEPQVKYLRCLFCNNLTEETEGEVCHKGFVCFSCIEINEGE